MVFTIECFILNNQGLPVEDATVMIVEGTSDFPDLAGVTDSKGAFGFTLKKGDYKLLIQKGGNQWYFPLEINENSVKTPFRWTIL